jgi:hypothetical protein
MQILELSQVFRPKTSHVYPPFKKGRYMEEFMYDYFISRQDIQTKYIYIPIFWTNMQNHPAFSDKRKSYQILFDEAIKDRDASYFTIVQHDDGCQLILPRNTIVFGACKGHVPLPLIYEDTTERLLRHPRVIKDLLASFVGTYTTHPIRGKMYNALFGQNGIECRVKSKWEKDVVEEDANAFLDLTSRSTFCLAPRGYGRSSFRFFEAMLLGAIPVYLWDDQEWLPYKDKIDYSAFSVSVREKDIPDLYQILSSISKDAHERMVQEGKKISHWFTMEGMAEYIVSYLLSFS